MKKEYIKIINGDTVIPALLWGDKSDKVIIGIHGYFSNKEDSHMEVVAKKSIEKGYCLLSIDLPEHGERQESDYKCYPWNGKEDLEAVYDYVYNNISKNISIFACSLGAYFSLLSYKDMKITKVFLLSPVVNMKKIIDNMMFYSGVDAERLKKEKVIPVDNGPALEWEYYNYVKQNPVDSWNKETFILHGSKDVLSELSEIKEFAKKEYIHLTEHFSAEHFFHTAEELEFFSTWLETYL